METEDSRDNFEGFRDRKMIKKKSFSEKMDNKFGRFWCYNCGKRQVVWHYKSLSFRCACCGTFHKTVNAIGQRNDKS